MREKAEVVFKETLVYFDKKDVELIRRQEADPFATKEDDIKINEYFNQRPTYMVTMRSGEDIYNVILSDEELKYLCE